MLFRSFYEWKEVIAIFVDDDYGRSGIAYLDDELEKRQLKISYKLPLPIQFDRGKITDMLNKSKLLGPRVYVVHVGPDPKLRIFSIAQQLEMINTNYVWLATDWLSTTLDSFSQMNKTSLRFLQGVVGLRQHIPESSQKRAFVSRWRKLLEGLANSELNTYGFQAYDTVWTVAYSIDKFVKEHRNITFSTNDKLQKIISTEMQMRTLKVFDNGSHLHDILLKTNFTGLSGQVQFNQDRNIVSGGYDVINIDQMAIHTVGYWSNSSGFSILPQENLQRDQKNYSRLNQKLKNVTWPGGKTERPRGWVIADNGKPLRIGVPFRASFVEFATKVHNSDDMQGYCIDVFKEALKLVPYDVPYQLEPFGDGHSNPNYDGIVEMVKNGVSKTYCFIWGKNKRNLKK